MRLGFFAKILFLVIFSNICPSAHASVLEDPEVEELGNGLRIAWFERKQLPSVDFALLVEAGSRNDTKGKSGTATLLGALLETGRTRASSDAHMNAQMNEIESLGAKYWVNTYEDSMVLRAHGLTADSHALVQMLAEMITAPDISQPSVARKKAKLQEEWKALAVQGETLASLVFDRLISAGTPYSRGAFASVREFSTITPADVSAFHKMYFVPPRATLAVIGRFNRKEMKKWIAEAFGGWQGKPPASEPKIMASHPIAKKRGERGVLIHRPGYNIAYLKIGLKVPNFKSSDFYPMIVANAAFGGYSGSRLNQRIRENLAVVYGIMSTLTFRKEQAYLRISSATRDQTTGHLISEVLSVLEDLGKKGFSQEEVERAKVYLRGSFPLRMSSVTSVAEQWLSGVIFERPKGFLLEFSGKIQAVSFEQVSEVFRRHFSTQKPVIVVSGDARPVRAGLKKYRLNPMLQVEVKELL